MRGFVLLVLAIGFFASLLGQIVSRASSGSREPALLINARNDEADRVAELKARNSPQFSSQDGSIELQRNEDGHFYADVRINGTLIHMLVDTGASSIALSRNDAQMAGLATSIGMNDVVGEGADGAVHGEYVRLGHVELGPLSAENLDAIVLNGGQQSLLGQSFLSRFASVQIKGDKMVLR